MPITHCFLLVTSCRTKNSALVQHHCLETMQESHGMVFVFKYSDLQFEACWVNKLRRFLAERGALVLLDDKDETVGMDEIYGKIAGGSYGCSWDAFQAYRHLKLLGYIVGRYDVPWTMKHICSGDVTNSPESMDGTSQSFGKANGACNDITKLLKEMRIDGMYPSFKVHLPNSKFKKSSPGVPSFLVCLLRDKPPSRDELETVENKFDGISLKFCQVDNGRISFLSFDKVTLPSLP